jgi:hypothetical protein
MAVATILVAFPPILFYAILFRTVQDIPLYDGYGGLDFVNNLVKLHGFAAKLVFVLTSQFNEYKLVFGQLLVWLQFSLSGRVDFRVLSAISNAFVLLLGLVLWKMFLPREQDFARRLTLFIPISWLLFQLEYFEILNWGGAGLQHIPSTVFAFATIYLLFRETRTAFLSALGCYVLAIASSGNGFLLLPIGLIALASGRRFARIAVWLAVSVACFAGYFYHYNAMSSKASPDHSIFSAILRAKPAYTLSFIGSAAGILFPVMSFFLGTALCIFFIWMARRKYATKNPTVSCCVLFLLLTAIGVAGVRSDLGLAQSVSSRYTLFSTLLVILAWNMIAEEFLQYDRTSEWKGHVYLGAVGLAMVFSILMDAAGLIMIRTWDQQLVLGMTAFEHPNPTGSTEGPDMPAWKGHPELESFNPIARAILFESIRLGVYRPPKL